MTFRLPDAVQPLSADIASPVGAANANHHKLSDAAQQFEGMLLQEMLKPMHQHSYGSLASDGSDSRDSDNGEGDTLSSFGTEALATAIARNGGLGIARQVIQQVEREWTNRASPGASQQGAPSFPRNL